MQPPICVIDPYTTGAPSPTQADIERLFSSLCVFMTGEEYVKAGQYGHHVKMYYVRLPLMKVITVSDLRDKINWCVKSFGPQSDPPHRWFARNIKFFFRNEQDRMLFLLKWTK